MVYTEEVAENVYLIDDNLYSVPGWGSVYLLKEDKTALIDSGPTTSMEAVIGGVRKLGLGLNDIDHIIITHIHLDHAGGAGTLAEEMPRAQVLVHHKGARHMVSPERLLKGVVEAQGQDMMVKCGKVVPIDQERVKSIYGDDVLELSPRQVLKFIDAPGHAPHELCIHESRNNGLFTGDALGVCVGPGDGILLPVTAPPNFDLEQFISTIERLMDLDASCLYFAHFCRREKAQENMQLCISKLEDWNTVIAETLEKEGLDTAAKKISALEIADLEPLKKDSSYQRLYKYMVDTRTPVSISGTGFVKYYREKHGIR
ncbi:MAG: MBL fold metallo-hydrolase [Chloroflexi bacterium]|nr:MBL fold metallo-hydrolase [Chloroflexota bacterium]